MKHYMTLYNEPFYKIKNQLKDIEMRLYDDKRKAISVGDIISFENVITKDVIEVEVIALHVFDDFKALYDSFDKQRLGYFKDEKASYKDMEMYYSVEKISQNKVVGIEIKLK